MPSSVTANVLVPPVHAPRGLAGSCCPRSECWVKISKHCTTPRPLSTPWNNQRRAENATPTWSSEPAAGAVRTSVTWCSWKAPSRITVTPTRRWTSLAPWAGCVRPRLAEWMAASFSAADAVTIHTSTSSGLTVIANSIGVAMLLARGARGRMRNNGANDIKEGTLTSSSNNWHGQATKNCSEQHVGSLRYRPSNKEYLLDVCGWTAYDYGQTGL